MTAAKESVAALAAARCLDDRPVVVVVVVVVVDDSVIVGARLSLNVTMTRAWLSIVERTDTCGCEGNNRGGTLSAL